MNAKRDMGVIIGMLLVSVALMAETEPFEPDFTQLSEISLSFNLLPEWRGRIWSDGRAKLERGPSPLGSANAPAESFSLKKIYTLVAPHLKSEHDDRNGVLQVGFYFGYSDTSGKGFFVEDKEVIRTLMYELRDKVVPFANREYFEALLSKYPLVPGDEPSPFVYDDQTYAAAFHAIWGFYPWEFGKPVVYTPASAIASINQYSNGKSNTDTLPHAEPRPIPEPAPALDSELTPEPPPPVIASVPAKQSSTEEGSDKAPAIRPLSRLCLYIIPLLIVAIIGIFYSRHKK